jgi:signal transduction histidine kinase
MRIREKLVIIFFTFIIIPMFLLWARFQGTAVGSIKTFLRQEISNRASDISDQITSNLKAQQNEIEALVQQPLLKVYARNLTNNPQALPDRDLLIELSAFLLTKQQYFSALLGVNREGAPLFKLEPRIGENGVIRPYTYFKDFSSDDSIAQSDLPLTSDSLVVSEIIQAMSSDPHFKIIAPLIDDANNVNGAFIVKVRADEMLKEAAGPRAVSSSNQTEVSHSEVIILSPQGTVLFATDAMKEWKPYKEVFREFDEAFTTLLQGKDVDDRKWDPWLIRHRVREESPKLSIFVVANFKTAVDSLESDSYVLLALTILLIIVAMLALYYLISSFTDSIRDVTRGAKAVATGNLGYQIKVKTKDETRVLAEAFNRMASRLREMIRKEGEQKQFESFARLSSVMTHDLKNQILSLSLLVSNMERKFDREGFKEDAMRTLSDSVNNLENLVAKLSDPRTPTKRVREASNLTHLVERVLQRTAAMTNNRYQVSVQLKPEVYATVDGKAIERVIENLVINALEAMPNGGSLSVTTQTDNGYALIVVADSGKGMTDEFMRDRLFHPFATTKKKGIGLGLYSCRDIIEQHGGQIDVASKVNAGTEFKIILPVLTEEQKIPEAEVAMV